ncbi:MAG: hypothetical protein GY847_11410, partial [Proteobacteria bacterium]|nr:hypothetical protein [Pseudomonadota bacterium]
HDFRSQAQGVAVPYGIYDADANHCAVFVGTSLDTAEFAVSSITILQAPPNGIQSKTDCGAKSAKTGPGAHSLVIRRY